MLIFTENGSRQPQQCFGKIGYATRGEAERVRGKVKVKTKHRGGGSGAKVALQCYRCDICGLFHLGNSVQRKK